jgi:hypothetical protein
VAIKTDGKLIGNLHVTIKVERTKKGKSNDSCKNKSGDALSLTLLVGSANQSFPLAQDSIRMGHFGKCTAERILAFEWDAAKAYGNHVML